MNCSQIQSRLTAYLDGELEDDRGSVVRGHLRECETCRLVAGDEAALRDGLRTLEPLDPPPSLWAGVQAQLAAAEVADAKRPAWRRAVARWAPAVPRFAVGGLVATAAVSVLWWRSHRGGQDEQPAPPAHSVSVTPLPSPPRPAPGPPRAPTTPSDDVTADLAAEAARTTATYAQTADELFALATDARRQWTDDRKAAFDASVLALRGSIERAQEGRPRQRAWRDMIRYLQGAVVRDEIALAGGAR